MANSSCPIPGTAIDNYQVNIRDELEDPDNFNFRPKKGTTSADKKIGPYDTDSADYWIPGRQEYKASFPIPSNGALVESIDKLIWRPAYGSKKHIVRFGDELDVFSSSEGQLNNIFMLDLDTIKGNKTY